MERLTLLIDYAAEAGQRPFRPGRHDCALFAAGWVKLATGRDLARGWRSTYRSLSKGQHMLEDAGYADHVALAAAHLPEVAPAFAQVGDIAVLDNQAFGIVAGVCQTSCPPISCGVSDFRGADFGLGVKPDGSGWLPVAGFPDQRCGFCARAFA